MKNPNNIGQSLSFSTASKLRVNLLGDHAPNFVPKNSRLPDDTS